jgi:hypothetical protein
MSEFDNVQKMSRSVHGALQHQKASNPERQAMADAGMLFFKIVGEASGPADAIHTIVSHIHDFPNAMRWYLFHQFFVVNREETMADCEAAGIRYDVQALGLMAALEPHEAFEELGV